MTSTRDLGIALPALILEAAKLAKERAERADADASPLLQTIRDFYSAYHEAVGVPDSAPAPPRFASAIQAIEPGIYDPVILANAMLAACNEVIRENGFAPTDFAVRLLAYQIGIVCAVPVGRNDCAELIFECTWRSLGL